jgi:hypothetical protein
MTYFHVFDFSSIGLGASAQTNNVKSRLTGISLKERTNLG